MTSLSSSSNAGRHVDLFVYGDIAWDVVVSARQAYSRAGSDIVTGGISTCSGGSAANCAVTAARLGVSVSFIGITGMDPMSGLLVDDLATNGVDTTHLRQAEGSPAVVVAINEGDNRRRFYSYRGVAAETAYGPLPSPLTAARDGWLHLSGYSFQDEHSRATAVALIDLARSAGWTISLDPSFHSAREFRSHQAPVLADVDILLPNMEEACLITGLESPVPAAQAIHRLGPEVVVLKMGAAGCVVSDGDDIRELPGFSVQPVVDTIGAGDAFCGGFIAGRLFGLEVRSACVVANAAAACTVQHPGGHTGSPTTTELTHFLCAHGHEQIAKHLYKWT